jgi:hypothetical protein
MISMGIYVFIVSLGFGGQAGVRIGYVLVKVGGALHLGIWKRGNAAAATYGDRSQRERIPLGFIIGFEVDDVGGSVAGVQGKNPGQTDPSTSVWMTLKKKAHEPSWRAGFHVCPFDFDWNLVHHSFYYLALA